MFEKLLAMKKRRAEIETQLSDPAVLSRQEEYKALTKEHASLSPACDAYEEYLALAAEKEAATETYEQETDKEMRELLYGEIGELSERIEQKTEELKILLLPKDPNDEKNVILEIRGGAGGDEAALFGADLLKTYLRYAEKVGWKTEEMDATVTELGGVKEAVYLIVGKGAYSKLKYESGVHRVQRVPETESQGRIHTSTVTVAVMPEAEEVEVNINENDLSIDTYRSGGAGGQHVNKTESAIRITHIPTGIVVQCQDERSQIKNREKAMKVLASRLYDYYAQAENAKIAADRKQMVGTGDRSERIRTYNFPQGRVTDHRIGLTLYSLDTFMMGDIDEMLEGLALADRKMQLSGEDK
ncbi:MAG: peptide chain release factor 1 [Clostridia bacterium]|nr:peptide chain release factor 1 [Clostridia bacterium]